MIEEFGHDCVYMCYYLLMNAYIMHASLLLTVCILYVCIMHVF